ncbi:MAG: hypothetical protein JKY88_01205 [Pseudomonadales bacterium]|nr:hypothetical protein [Pseudomonadales bacterium]
MERFTADKNVLKGNGTEVAGADGVPLVFKMKQLKGVSIHNLLNKNENINRSSEVSVGSQANGSILHNLHYNYTRIKCA